MFRSQQEGVDLHDAAQLGMMFPDRSVPYLAFSPSGKKRLEGQGTEEHGEL